MRITPDRVATERDRTHARADRTVRIINEVRTELGDLFDTAVEPVTVESYQAEVDRVFDNGDLAVNVAALAGILRELDVENDYPGFVVDEYLGRRLAGVIAGGEPLTLLAEATFHFADVAVHGDADEAAGVDDLDAALAAGFQTRLPGWPWREKPGPFGTR